MIFKFQPFKNAFIIIVVFSLNLYADLIHVPLQQSTIQAGIDAANNGDTVLVEQGVYTENINFNGKTITVASNCLISDDTTDIANTIIDGKHQGSVVVIANEEDSTSVLCGFTIRNGIGTEESYDHFCGGGIYIKSAHPRLKSLKVTRNSAFAGAGIYLSYSNSEISNVQVYNNNGPGLQAEDSDIKIYNSNISNNVYCGFQCYRTNALLDKGIISNNGGTENPWGGGISCSHSSYIKLSQLTINENAAYLSGGGIWCYESQIEFDDDDRCSVYLNYAPEGSDISSYNSSTIHVIVDTFTVLNPTEYHASPLDKFIFNINTAKIIPVEADLYVSPNGNDSNDGLSPEQPLKTIGAALRLIKADEQHPHSIYLADGIYSPQTNGEYFPISLKSHVSILGTNESTTILDANDINTVVHCSNIKNLDIKNLTIRNGNFNNGSGGGICIEQSNPHLENITVTDNIASDAGGILIHYYSNPILKNITIRNNTSLLEGHSGTHVGGGGLYIGSECNPVLDNVLIEGNIAQKGAGIRCNENSNPRIINTVIRNNTASKFGGGFYVYKGKPILENVIIKGNSSDKHAGGIYCWEADITLNKVSIDKNNAVGNCGGIYTEDSQIDLKSVTISENIAGNSRYDYGGGIYSKNSILSFNKDSLCNIYLNKAAHGNDIYSDAAMYFEVDSFTVLQPTKYHLNPVENFTFNINNGKLKQITGNLYVSPTGDNSNSGINEDNPLKNIDHAQCILYADSLTSGIIHLAEGTYNKSSNQERLPIYGLDYITISGADKNTTIIDAKDSSDVFRFNNCKGSQIKNVTITRGNLFNIYIKDSHIQISDAKVLGSLKYGIYADGSHLTLTNINVMDNNDEGITYYNCEGIVENSILKRNNFGIISDQSNLDIIQTEICENKHAGISLKSNSLMNINGALIKKNQTRGVQIVNSQAQLVNVLIKENYGGGLSCLQSLIGLGNVTISENQTTDFGGGIYMTDSSIVDFDPHNLCNIYLNKAGIGRDLFSENCSLTNVYLDTFTVKSADSYFASPIASFNFSIQTGKITQIREDLFVSPNGDDKNEGTSQHYPLKTIDMALLTVLADSLHPRNIFLSGGFYSKSSNGEFFPINLKGYISLYGANNGNTILDAENESRIINCYHASGVHVHDILFKNGNSHYGAGTNIVYSNPEFSNVHFDQNSGIGLYCDHSSPRLFRTGISNGDGGGIHCINSNIELINTTLTRNGYSWAEWEPLSFYFYNSDIIIINSIIWDNSSNYLYSVATTDSHSISIAYSDIQDGESSLISEGNIKINWLENNINSDPFFKDSENNDYSLSENSPCIDTGTSFFIWQEDTLINLQGKLYWGIAPDMGAIEFDSLSAIVQNNQFPSKFYLYQNYPNPFNPSTKIKFSLPKPELVKIEIYNIIGQKIATLLNKHITVGYHEVVFNGKNLSSGVYLYSIQAGAWKDVKKMVLIK